MDTLESFLALHSNTENFTHIVENSGSQLGLRISKDECAQFYDLSSSHNIKVSERILTVCPVIYKFNLEQELDDVTKLRIVRALQFVITYAYEIDDKHSMDTVLVSEDDGITITIPRVHVELSMLRGPLKKSFLYVLDSKNILKNADHYINDLTLLPLDYDTDDVTIYPANASETTEPQYYQDYADSEELESPYWLFSQYLLPFIIPEKKKHTDKQIKVSCLTDLIAERTKEKAQHDINIALEIIDLLDINRCNTWNGFKEVGQCLFNISNGSEQGLELWKRVCVNSDFLPDCGMEWQNFTKTNITIGTLRYWCKTDQPEKYKAWQDTNIDKMLWACVRPTAGSRSIAKILYHKYRDLYICSSIKNELWYEFKGHRFEQIDGGVTLRNLLSTEIKALFEPILDDCNEKVQELADSDQQKDIEIWVALQKKCVAIISGLDDPGYKTKVMKEALELFYDPKFEREKNQNQDLVAFENGVWDCKLCKFRAGVPDDKITMSTGYNYREYTEQDSDIQMVREYFRKVLTQKNKRDSFLRFISSLLKGVNRHKAFGICWGPGGNNAKSMTEYLIELAFGEYSAKPPIELLTYQGDSNPNNATPALETLRFARAILFDEPKGGTTRLNDSILKKLSSGIDSLYSRGLNRDPVKFIPPGVPFLFCNRIPSADTTDPAVIARLLIFEFDSKFSKSAPITEEEQFRTKTFPVDVDFNNKIQKMVQPFMWVLTEEYKKYAKEGLFIPEEVTLAVEKYRLQNDTFQQFLDECLDIVPEQKEKQYMLHSMVYQKFTFWLGQNYASERKPSAQEVRDLMSKKGLEYRNGKYYGVKTKAEN